MGQVSKSVDGSGWGILTYHPMTDQLVVLQCENDEMLTQWGAIPLLVIDVWEHAYYRKYKIREQILWMQSSVLSIGIMCL